MRKRIFSFLSFACFFIQALFFSHTSLADNKTNIPANLRISQIDNRFLLINQRLNIYIGVTDIRGKPVKNIQNEGFRIFESSSGNPEKERSIIEFQQGVNQNRGINLLFLIDNSGSMYWDGSGKIKNSQDESIWRITHAKKAVKGLLKEIKNPQDRVSLISFNVRIDVSVEPTGNKVEVERSLEKIKKPPEEEAYTELYEALYVALLSLRNTSGRKAIILLSDGINFPMENNPYFLQRKGLGGAIELAENEGISVFTIGFSERADNKTLNLIAQKTGGAHFSVYNIEELEMLYYLIREQILDEYLITCRAGMDPASKKTIRVTYTGGGKTLEANREYYSGTIMGHSLRKYPYWIPPVIPVCVFFLWVLSMIRFRYKLSYPTIEVRGISGKKGKAKTIAITRGEKAFTISSSKKADVTISAERGYSRGEVTIQGKNGDYTLYSGGLPVTVNNRAVTRKKLKPGDFIQVGETSMVFDTGIKNNKKKKPRRKM